MEKSIAAQRVGIPYGGSLVDGILIQGGTPDSPLKGGENPQGGQTTNPGVILREARQPQQQTEIKK